MSHHHIVKFLSSASSSVYAYLGAVPVDLVDPGPEHVDYVADRLSEGMPQQSQQREQG